MKRRLISFAIVLCLAFGFGMTTFAHSETLETGVKFITIEEFNEAGNTLQPDEALVDENGQILTTPAGNVGPLYVPCPSYGGKHQMAYRGYGDVYVNGVRKIKGGCCTQCIYCGDTMISEYVPYQSNYLGYYGYVNYPYDLTIYTSMSTNTLWFCSNWKTDVFFDSLYFL